MLEPVVDAAIRTCARQREIGAGASTAAASGSGVRSFMVGHRRRVRVSADLTGREPGSGAGSVLAMAAMNAMDGQPSSGVEAVAAFDFDGTLSTRDNFMPFLKRLAGTSGIVRALAVGAEGARVGALPMDPRRREGRGRAPAPPPAAMRRIIECNARDPSPPSRAPVTSAPRPSNGPTGTAPRATELVIVSASLAVTSARSRSGSASTRCSRPSSRSATTVASPADAGRNVRGAEKRRGCSTAGSHATARHDPFIWAYGDSSGDNGSGPVADRAVRLGRRTRTWAPPDPARSP